VKNIAGETRRDEKKEQTIPARHSRRHLQHLDMATLQKQQAQTAVTAKVKPVPAAISDGGDNDDFGPDDNDDPVIQQQKERAQRIQDEKGARGKKRKSLEDEDELLDIEMNKLREEQVRWKRMRRDLLQKAVELDKQRYTRERRAFANAKNMMELE
jgi:predicted secreted protein